MATAATYLPTLEYGHDNDMIGIVVNAADNNHDHDDNHLMIRTYNTVH